MNNVIPLWKLQKERAPERFKWSMSQILIEEACLLGRNLAKMSELLSQQLTLIEALLAALPSGDEKTAVCELIEVSGQKLADLEKFLVEQRSNIELLRS